VVAYWKTHKPTIKDLARHFAIKLTSAYNLIAAFKKDEDFLVKKRWKEERRQEQDAAIKQAVERMQADGRNIWNAEQVQAMVAQESHVEVKKHRVTQILRSHFNMSFRNVRHAALLGNENRALVLRQHWAKILLPALANRKRILVVDESWLTTLDQRRRKWGPRGQKNTLVQKELGKKVNIIAGLDTDGRVYVALH
jgi:transposase